MSLDGKVAYVLSGDRVAAFEVETGTVLWQQALEGETYSMVRAHPIVMGGTVAVAVQDKVVLLDRRTGAILTTVDLEGAVLQFVGPPLVALVDRGGSPQLLSIDPTSGAVLARKELGTGMSTLQLEGDVLLTSTIDWNSSDPDRGTAVVAFRNGDLEELWRQTLPAYSAIEKVGSQLYALLPSGECGVEGERRSFDVSSGEIGALLPRREPGETGSGLDWELQVVWSRADKTASRLRRNSPATGNGIWNRGLPCVPRAFAREGETLWLDCVSGSGRGLLLQMDWRTGGILQAAYGLRGTMGLRVWGDLVLATTNREVAAISARRFAAPEASRPMEDEIRRLLADAGSSTEPGAFEGSQTQTDGLVDDLRAFGSDALPILSEEARTAKGAALAATARVLGEAAYRASEPNLRARLQDSVDPASVFPGAADPHVEILRALSRIGSEDSVPAIIKALGDPERRGSVRRQALAALTTLHTLASLRAIDETLSTLRQKNHAVWHAPSPPPERTSPPTEEELEKLIAGGDPQAFVRIGAGLITARTALPQGGSLIIFGDPALGYLDDLWMAEVGRDGVARRAYFLGVRAPIEIGEAAPGGGPTLSVRLEKKTLVIEGPGKAPLRVALADVKRDSDGDGLTDLVEQRLGTDPHQADSDGDGLKDSEDPAPTATVRAARNEKEEILLALFEQYFLLEKSSPDRSDLAVVVGGPPLEWRGRSGPTTTSTTDEMQQRLRTDWSFVATRISIAPGSAEQLEARGVSLGRGDRAYSITVLGFAFPDSLDVVMNRVGDRWLIREILTGRDYGMADRER